MNDGRRDGGTPKTSETVVAAAFLIAGASATGFAIVYWQGGQPQLEGLLLAAALGGLALGLAIWASKFMPGGEHVEQRHRLASSEGERAELITDLERGRAISRRGLLFKLLGLAGAAVAGVIAFPVRSLGPRPHGLGSTAWKAGRRLVTKDGAPVRLDDLDRYSILTVYAEGSDNAPDSQTLLIRLGDDELKVRPGREEWSPQGLVAYSKICTHAGCPVGLYETETQQLLCPCHQSIFDVLDGARPIIGPATRSLPQLPLVVDDDGFVRARSDYTEPVGPAYWTRS